MAALRKMWYTGAAVIAAGVLTAACASSGGGGGTASTGAAAGAGGSQTIESHSGPMGTYLTDGHGMSLYMFASDTSTKSSCNAQCLNYWPAVAGPAKAGSGVTASKLGTITGTNGAKQASYAGHPLYYYAQDSKPGDTLGQGSNNFGAKWWLLAPSGQPITSSSHTSGGASSSSSSNPYGGGGGGGGGWS